MKGDPGGSLACPICGRVVSAAHVYPARGRTLSTRSTLRQRIDQHVAAMHPGLGARARSELIQASLEGVRTVAA